MSDTTLNTAQKLVRLGALGATIARIDPAGSITVLLRDGLDIPHDFLRLVEAGEEPTHLTRGQLCLLGLRLGTLVIVAASAPGSRWNKGGLRALRRQLTVLTRALPEPVESVAA